MGKWREYINNPFGRNVGDCAVRAVAKAIGADWERAYAELALAGFTLGDMPNSNAVIGSVLKQYGFVRHIIPNECPDCYTVSDFADDHPKGTFVLGTGNHVVVVESGEVWDSWDSTREVPVFYWEIQDEDEKGE